MNNDIIAYSDILNLCNKFEGRLFENLDISENRPARLTVAYDLIKRIGNNIRVVSLIRNEEFSIPSQQLLLRSVISDLIEGVYLLSCNDELFTRGIKTLDLEHVRFFKESLELRTELYKKMRPKEIIGSLQLTMDKYYDYVSSYLISNKGEPWKIVSLKEIRDDKMKCKISEMCNALKNNANEILHQYYYLYHYYRLLSQSEHYTLLGRSYSNTKAEDLKKEVRGIIYVTIEQMELLLEDELNA